MNSLESKHKYFMHLAIIASLQSKCLKRKIGCVIVDDEFHVKAIGYNGVPKGFNHCETCLRDIVQKEIDKVNLPKGYTVSIALPDCPAIHAEANALLQLENKRYAVAMYTTTFPCIHCAKLLCNTNIKNIFYLEEYETDPQNNNIVQDLFNTAEIIVTKFDIKGVIK